MGFGVMEIWGLALRNYGLEFRLLSCCSPLDLL